MFNTTALTAIIILAPVTMLVLYLLCLGLGLLLKKKTGEMVEFFAGLAEELAIFLLLAWGVNAILTLLGRVTGVLFFTRIAAIGGGVAALLLFLRVGRLYQKVPNGIRRWVKYFLLTVLTALVEAILLGAFEGVNAWMFFPTCIPVCLVWYALVQVLRPVFAKLYKKK